MTKSPTGPARRRPLILASSLILGSLCAAQTASPPTSPVRTGTAGATAGGGSPGAQSQGLADPREAMWPAPTAEDWKKPCLIEWERSWEDALAVARETGRAILVCVNMDGEIASEHYAGVRYRQADIAALYEPYVTVIASVYRHTPRDFDEQGRRVLCPRFGSVTCGEHITLEPIIFEKFLDGRRIAPRHIGVELDGSEMYDVFYAFDTESVFRTVNEGILNREREPIDVARGDRPIEERVLSRANEDRVAVETVYLESDLVQRRVLLEKAREGGEDAPVDLLRLAVYDLDVELNRLAREALARSTSESAIALIAEALRVPMEEAEREALVAALERLAEKYPHAQTLAVVHRGLARRSDAVDVEGWSRELAGAEYPAPPAGRGELEARLERKAGAAGADPDNAQARLDEAEATLALALDPDTMRGLQADPKTAHKFADLLYEDARRAAREAQEQGAEGWRVHAVLGLSAYYLGDLDEAYARAAQAVELLPQGEASWNSMAVLGLFAESRQRDIREAVQAKTEWPPSWLTDVNAAYDVLAQHPLGTADHAVAHHDFLLRLGANGPAARVLDDGLERFPDSGLLHERLRRRILAERGVQGLVETYDAMLQELDARPTLEWFAGYANLMAAEYRRRAGQPEQARGSYLKAIGHFERSIERNPQGRDSADHYVAVAHGGLARLAYEGEDYARAAREILASLERRPESAASLDGMGHSTVTSAKLLIARLQDRGELDLAQSVESALEALDPELLLPPVYDRVGPASGGAARQRGPGSRGSNG